MQQASVKLVHMLQLFVKKTIFTERPFP